jgi:dienelactone hydrolase
MSMRKILSIAAGLALLVSVTVEAKVVTKTIEYTHEGVALQGYLAYDDAQQGSRPGVLVVPEWWGLNDYAKTRARQLADMGYVAFAADMYGGAKTTRDAKQAGEWSSAVGGKPGLLASRAKAGLDVLRKQSQTNGRHLAAIGFCFGGGAVLQLAYSGETLDGVVSFHGSLAAPDTAQQKQIKSSILVLHGAEDTFIKPQTIDDMRKGLDAAGADWYMVTYAHAVHAFTNPDADNYKLPGVGYNEKAARRSWDEMQRFFKEKF